MKYNVFVEEMWVRCVQVEADSFEEAIKIAGNGCGEELDFEYSHTLNSDWKVALATE